mgnify:CR=1 FL=1
MTWIGTCATASVHEAVSMKGHDTRWAAWHGMLHMLCPLHVEVGTGHVAAHDIRSVFCVFHPCRWRLCPLTCRSASKLHLAYMMPIILPLAQVIVIDEIGTSEECGAARTIAQRGVQLVATAHGNELENVIKNPQLADLVRATWGLGVGV